MQVIVNVNALGQEIVTSKRHFLMSHTPLIDDPLALDGDDVDRPPLNRQGGAVDLETITGARILMARKLADLIVLPTGHLTANERALVGDILLQVLDKVEYSLRIDIADRVARVPDVPETILLALLTDKPEVAEPILTQAITLSETVLIECVNRGETAHRMMVARRFGLTTAVADALLNFDEPEVAKLILRRDDCALSQVSIELLVSRSTVDAGLQTLLVERSELEPAHGFMMFWWLPAACRRHVLTRFALDRSTIQETLADLYPVIRLMDTPDPLVKEILALNDRRHRPRGINGEQVSMDVVNRTLGLARQYPSEEIIEALGMIAGISRELAARILRDPGGEPYAVLCKAMGVPRTEFLEFLAGGGEGLYDDGGESAVSAERAEELLDLFDRMARDFARAVLRYWDWDGNPRIARIARLLTQNHQALVD